jgi:hypothetical protein
MIAYSLLSNADVPLKRFAEPQHRASPSACALGCLINVCTGTDFCQFTAARDALLCHRSDGIIEQPEDGNSRLCCKAPDVEEETQQRMHRWSLQVIYAVDARQCLFVSPAWPMSSACTLA